MVVGGLVEWFCLCTVSFNVLIPFGNTGVVCVCVCLCEIMKGCIALKMNFGEGRTR